MTIEERADRYIDNNFTRIAEEMPICEGMKTLYIESATEQKAIDSKMFDEFLCSLRNGNMWEGREWRFQRMWREYVENYIAMEE